MRVLLIIASLLCFDCGFAEQSYEKVSSNLTVLFNKVENHEISIADAILAIDENDIDLLLKPSVINPENSKIIAEGRIACTGAVQGVLCFDLSDLEKYKAEGKLVIWVTDNITNDDLCHLHSFDGIFAINEDPSSHAIIVTRVYNIPCLTIPPNVFRKGNCLITPSGTYKHGDEVTLDGFNGRLLSGKVPLHHNIDNAFLNKILAWSEEYAHLAVHVNADNAKEAHESLEFGAKGADPRTEHMFFQPDRLHLFRKVILCKDVDESILNELKELQRADFIDLFQTMKSLPVKIRLLDPPLHEFLPQQEENLIKLAKDFDIPLDQLKNHVQDLQETNPMMGHRGVRLLLTRPSILKMQVRAIFEASLHPSLTGESVVPHIIIPMIISSEEVVRVKRLIADVYNEISHTEGKTFTYKLGIMMETPRACLLAGEIAPYVDFISFGTNDLTGQTLALARGDVYDKFLKTYLELGLLKADPFSRIDPAVKELMRICVTQMRSKNSQVVIGICGEHASQKEGVFTCHQLGLDTVSCAAFRVPAVKLFAAQAAILHPR
ncbi:MAG: hypothetical protein H0U49_12675 [Parachlamydiaceae bacterium]|nr:hypothetical protein [Parachlamydiaceae bacterium]